MKLQTQIPLARAENQIGYSSHMFLLGSCFVENIGSKLDYFKFRALQNPFGILFHPLAIENLIQRAVLAQSYTEQEIFNKNGQWLCFDAHSDLSDMSKENLLQKLNDALLKTRQELNKASHIIITLGTAWAYRYSETNTMVANCHKVPQKEFSKELLSINAIVDSLEGMVETIKSANPNAQLIFTISPVRHLKDGFVENQQSKAHLITALQELLALPSLGTYGSYFPAYELMMDELRDYRFYEADMVHPNQLAIDYIWEKLKSVWISEEIYRTMDEVEAIQKGLHHRPFNRNSEQHQQFLKSLDKKITYLQQEHPFMEFSR